VWGKLLTSEFPGFLFGAATNHGLLTLPEMRPHEGGSLVVSPPILPRYRIGVVILAFDASCFRRVGHDKPFTPAPVAGIAWWLWA